MSNLDQTQCTRCGGAGTIELPEVGRHGMGNGRLFRIPCPHCGNGGGKHHAGQPATLRRAPRPKVSALQHN